MTAGLLELARLHAAWLVLASLLCGAALAVALPRLAWFVAVLAALVAATLAADVMARTLFGQPEAVVAQEGIALSIDGISAFAVALIAVITALIAIGSGALLEDFSSRVAPFAVSLMLCVTAGWIAALFAPGFVELVICSEAAWLAALGLTALSDEDSRGAANGAMRMLMIGGAGAALSVFGAAMVVRAIGATAFAAIGDERIAAPNLAALGFALLIVAMASKAAIAPLHFWAGAAFGRGSRLSALVIGGVGVIGALSVIVRLAAILSAAPDLGLGAAGVLAVLGAATAVIGSVQAVGARDLRRLAAYAAASQGGCILLGLAIGSPAELAASLVQLLALAVAMVALLGGAAAVTDGSLVVVDGLARRAPLASAAIAAGSLSLIGAPLTIGFLGRWRMIEAGVAADWWWATGAVLAASLAAVIYGGRLIERIYFRHATVQTMDAERSWRRVLIAPALIFAIAVIVVGVNPDFVLRAAAAASTLQLGRP